MQHASNKNDEVPISEMEIVNTFTKLIFGDDTYSARELSIIDAFKCVDGNVSRDELSEIGGYLRNLGVREMIQLVARVHRYMAAPTEPAPKLRRKPPRASTGLQDNPHRDPR